MLFYPLFVHTQWAKLETRTTDSWSRKYEYKTSIADEVRAALTHRQDTKLIAAPCNLTHN